MPNPVPWCRTCVIQARRDELQRHFEDETQDPRQHEWSKSDRVKMDVRSLKNEGVVYKEPEREHPWAVSNRTAQIERSEAKNWVSEQDTWQRSGGGRRAGAGSRGYRMDRQGFVAKD